MSRLPEGDHDEVTFLARMEEEIKGLNCESSYAPSVLKEEANILSEWQKRIEMFKLRLRRERLESEFLQFMLGTFADYSIKDGAISFQSAATRQKYRDLSNEIKVAGQDAQNFQKQQFQSSEAVKRALHQMAQ